jgi:AbrB family looped-hinge helix DNA binding protein
MVESRITSKYQITIPKKIRERYQIKEGDEVIFLPFGDKILLEKKKPARLSQDLPLERRFPKVKDVHEWREVAKERVKK